MRHILLSLEQETVGKRARDAYKALQSGLYGKEALTCSGWMPGWQEGHQDCPKSAPRRWKPPPSGSALRCASCPAWTASHAHYLSHFFMAGAWLHSADIPTRQEDLQTRLGGIPDRRKTLVTSAIHVSKNGECCTIWPTGVAGWHNSGSQAGHAILC